MKENINEENKPAGKVSSRREMLKLGMLAGGVAILGAEAVNLFAKNEPSGEKVKVLTVDGKMIEVEQDKIKKIPQKDKDIREGVPGKKFVMVIDLARCGNKRTCVEA